MKSRSVEYVKPIETQSNTLGAVGTTLGGAALLGVAGNMIGSTISRYGSQIANNIAATNDTIGFVPSAKVVAPTAQIINNAGYVTEKEINLIRENAGKDSIIAQLTAEKYADRAVKDATEKLQKEFKDEIEPLKARVCDLETEAAVSQTSNREYRRYADRAYVHQPKAYMRNRIVSCETSECCCDNHCGGGHHDHHN